MKGKSKAKKTLFAVSSQIKKQLSSEKEFQAAVEARIARLIEMNTQMQLDKAEMQLKLEENTGRIDKLLDKVFKTSVSAAESVDNKDFNFTFKKQSLSLDLKTCSTDYN